MIDTTRLRSLLNEHGVSQSMLARMLDVSPSAISQLMRGKTRDSRLGPAIASTLRVSLDYLEGKTDDPFERVDGSITPRELADQLKLKLIGQAVYDELGKGTHVPYYHLDADWLFAIISRFDSTILNVEDPSFIPPTMVVQAGTDAMHPTITKGDDVSISLWTNEVNVPDGIWFLEYGGLRMIRRLMPLPDGQGFRVYGDNPAAPTFEASAKDIRVIGRAFWIGRQLF